MNNNSSMKQIDILIKIASYLHTTTERMRRASNYHLAHIETLKLSFVLDRDFILSKVQGKPDLGSHEFNFDIAPMPVIDSG